jgi:diguanylate cyclase (GGDEF)-like protein/PAS domain S-box-containing protein
MDNDKAAAQGTPLIATGLQELVSLCPDPVIAVNRAGVIVLFNSAAESLLGYRCDEVVERLSIAEVYATADQARFIKKQLHTSPDRHIKGHETQLLCKEGRVVDIRLSAKLLMREGEEFGSIGFFHDLTETKQLEAKLKNLSITDSLTGLYNQRHFFAILEPEMERAKRYLRPLNLICIDLDNFKQVNDVLGHLEGDAALRFTANIITKQLRRTDVAFRYGGDEFMVLLPETSSADAELIGRRLTASFDRRWAEEWSPKPGCPAVSISAGVAAFDQHETPESLVRRADDLMYESKKGGGR